ncbi:MAG: PepSY domain-containing protein [Xanthomonadales bacterium]|nr:PepSY domain-containing protein [Xanthomonadales bacterium]
MKHIIAAPLFLAAALLSAAAVAAPQCTTAPRAQWLTEAAIKQQVLDQGYTIKVFQVSGNCYEIYGKDKAGKNVEIYFDPTDGHIVKKKGG